MSRSVATRTPVSPIRFLGGALAALTAAAMLTLGLTAPASATVSATGSFNLTLQTYYDHTVESDPSAPVNNAALSFWHYSNDDQQWEQLDQNTSFRTNSNGQLTTPLTGLVVGDQYAVYVDATQATDAHNGDPITDANGWVTQQGELTASDFDGNPSDGPDADTYFTATAGLFAPIQDLEPGLTLTGNILAPDSEPNDVITTDDANEIDIYRQQADPNGNTSFVFYSSVDPTGSTYSVTDLAQGYYDVQADQDSTTAWPPSTINLGDNSFDSSTPVNVSYSSGPAATQDVQFVNAGSIAGTVTLDPALDASDGNVAEVWAFPLNTANQVDGTGDDAYSTDVDPTTGSYSLALAPGKYDVEFEPRGTAVSDLYYPSWYGNASISPYSTPITISAADDAHTGVDGTIGLGVTVAGTVTSTTAGELDGISASLVSTDPDPTTGESDTFSATTNASGSYSVTAPPGTYNLQFSDPSGTYPDRYFTGSTDGSPNPGLGTVFSEPFGTADGDFVYDGYSTLTVHLTNKAGTALSGVDVSANAMADGTFVPNGDDLEGTAVTGHPGSYQLSGLQLGQSYALFFQPSLLTAAGTYAQYYGGSIDPSTSDLFTANSSTSSLDITLDSSASISGVVATTASKGIKGAEVDLYNFDGTSWNYENTVTTSSTGAYSFPNLATGSYTVDFDTSGNSPYVSVYAGGAQDPDSAVQVYVAPGKPAVLNQKLALGGTISGVVAGPGGSPTLGYIEVDPVALTGTPGDFTAATPYTSAYADSTTNGKFSLVGLPTGYYALSFTDESGAEAYGNPYVSPVGDPSSTTAIYHVVAGKATAAGTIDVPTLSSQATASVVGSLDTSLAGTFNEAAGDVYISDASGNFVGAADIQSDGTFETSLVPGDYTYSALVFDPSNPQSRFAEEDGDLSVIAGDNPLVIPVIPAVPLAFTTDPAIVDASDSDVGTTYQLNDVTWNHTDATASYQWMRGTQPIYGATGTSYTSQGADVGSDLEVRVTLTDDYLTVSPLSDVDETVVDYATAADPVTPSSDLFNTEQPSTSADGVGTITVGQVVHAQPGDWNDIPGASYTYQWILDGTSTVLGTGPTFTETPAMADAGGSVRLSVSASKLGYTTPASASDGDSLLMLPLTPPTLKVAPKITSKAVGTSTQYTVTPGTWSVAGTTPAYQWRLIGSSTVVSTTNSYTFSPIAPGDPTGVTVTVEATKSGYQPGSTTLTARKSSANIQTSSSTTVTDSVVGPVSSYSTEVPVGSTLSLPAFGFTYPDDNSVPSTYTYQWYRVNVVTFASTAIKGATKSTYAVQAADVGFNLRAQIEAGSSSHAAAGWTFIGGNGELRQDLVNSPATVSAAVANTNAPLTRITDTVGAWGSTTAVTDAYQWLICTDSDCTDPTTPDYSLVTGAKLAYYTPTLAQANAQLVLRVTGSKSTYASETVYGPITTVGDGHTITPVVSPTISAGLTSGKATFGVKLTAKAGTFDVPGAAITYSWQLSTDGGSNWSPATGANGLLAYTPVLGDFTSGPAQIRVSETATKSGYTSATSVSAAATLAQATPVPIVRPVVTTVKTTTSVHGSWTVTPGTWPVAGGTGTVSYLWLVNNSSPWPVNGTLTSDSTNTFDSTTVTPADYVELLVEYSGGAAYKPAFAVFNVQVGTAPAWNSPTISGTPTFGNTLSVTTTAADAFIFPSVNTSAFLSYQWYSGSTAIAKATDSTFTPSSAYVGKTISVKITTTSQDYATASHLTAGVPFAAAPAPDGAPILSYTGTVHPGGTVGVALGDPISAVSHSYQWQLSTDGSTWTNISGATKPTYLVTAVELGDELRALVGNSKAGYQTGSDYTDVEPIVEPTVLAPTTAPTLGGTGAVGATLTVSPGVWNVTGTTFGYEWFRDGIEIPGVTGTTYTPTFDEFGEVISVQVTAHAAGYDAVTTQPNSVPVITGAAPTVVSAPRITGSMVAGSTLTTTDGVWSLDGLTVTYQWYSGSGVATPISGATSSTWTVDESLHGQRVFVVVTVTRDGYAQATAASLSTAPVV